MTLEIEVKAYTDDLNKTEETVINMGAHFVEELHEVDTYFNHPSRDFAETDEALRIRVSNTHHFLTYKGEKIDPYSITRDEIETRIENADAAQQLLAKLGFIPVAEVKKTRRVYQLRKFTICVDDVSKVGTFVEVETTGESLEDLRNGALGILKTLGLTAYERKSYLELLLEKGEKIDHDNTQSTGE